LDHCWGFAQLSYRAFMAVFVRKLLRIGRLPGELRAEVEAEGLLFIAEYVAVTRRFRGAVPGLRSAGSIASYVGALVLTNQRVLGTLSSVPKLAGRTIDIRWDAPQSGAVKAELSTSGLTLDVDVAAVDPRCSGELSLHYKEDIPPDVLDRLPRTSLAFDVPAEFIFRAVGVPYHP
jgi:hypothetical protein